MEHSIELSCVFADWRKSDIFVAGFDLKDLRFEISLINARKIFDSWDKKKLTEDEVNAAGGLVFEPPGFIRGKAFYEDSVLWELSRIFANSAGNDIRLWITVNTATERRPGWLTREEQPHGSIIYRWPESEGLVIRDVAVVLEPSRTRVEDDGDPPQMDPASRAIIETKDAITKAITKMGTYILIMLGLLLGAALARLH